MTEDKPRFKGGPIGFFGFLVMMIGLIISILMIFDFSTPFDPIFHSFVGWLIPTVVYFGFWKYGINEYAKDKNIYFEGRIRFGKKKPAKCNSIMKNGICPLDKPLGSGKYCKWIGKDCTYARK